MFKVGDVWINSKNIVSISELTIETETFKTNPEYVNKTATGKINGMIITKSIHKDKFTSQTEWATRESQFRDFCFAYEDLLKWCKFNL